MIVISLLNVATVNAATNWKPLVPPKSRVMAACNTASSDGTPGAEGLSGLAKAFFYAGSRALLVSHWPVESRSAAKLTTRMLKEAKDKTIGRAEALKRSMLAIMNTPKQPHLAHPMFWAPFTVVGEGGGKWS